MLRLGLLGMLNWARTWYRPGPGHKTPARIGREMVGLLRGRAGAVYEQAVHPHQ